MNNMQPLSNAPMRIHVTGNAGAGKTSLAVALGQRLQLPVFHLDAIVWQPHWHKTPDPARRLAEQALIGKPHWIIEGVSDEVRHAADCVLVVDTPPLICAWRAFKRNLPYAFRSRPGLPEHCPEILIAPRLLKMIFRFGSRVRPKFVQEHLAGRNIHWLSKDADLEQALKSVSPS